MQDDHHDAKMLANSVKLLVPRKFSHESVPSTGIGSIDFTYKSYRIDIDHNESVGLLWGLIHR